MSFSSGVFSINSTGQPVVTGTTISSTVFNAFTADIATGLSTCVLKDGTQTISANIPMSGFKFTGLASGTAATDSATLAQVQSGVVSYLTSVSGTNTITATASPTATLAVGQRYWFIPANTNTGATTLQIGSNSAGAVQWVGAALTGGEIVASRPLEVLVTATTPVFEIVAPTQFPDTRALVIGGTDATKKLRLEVDGLTTATTRVWTALDADFTIGSATQAQQETGSATTVSVTPGVQHFHVSASKAWVRFNGTGTPAIGASYNVTSITDNGTGDWTVNFTTAFSSASYGGAGSGGNGNSDTTDYFTELWFGSVPSASSARILVASGGRVATDVVSVSAVFFGDQA